MKIEDVLSIHKTLIDRFGGSHGVRDKSLLESAIQRPYSTFDGKDLYPSTQEKASALIESILINHPFVDGNKRTGYTLFRLLILNDGLDISATEEQKYKFVIGIASGELKYDSILKWIQTHLK